MGEVFYKWIRKNNFEAKKKEKKERWARLPGSLRWRHTSAEIIPSLVVL